MSFYVSYMRLEKMLHAPPYDSSLGIMDFQFPFGHTSFVWEQTLRHSNFEISAFIESMSNATLGAT